MKRLCIIPCGAKKIWDVDPDIGSSAAKDVYLSPFHQACRKYAQSFFADWVILSAKHGFLRAEDIVPENYDVTFGMRHPEIMPNAKLKAQAEQKKLLAYDEIVMLGGKKYRPVLKSVFGDSRQITYPLAGYRGIGYMLQALKKAVDDGREIKAK
ncbi:hypothetical protein VSK91_17945 [Bacillus swezeyi]|uniref:DUF6884 domain-containing protein n=1 Tax=Bacillus swezeyi TaxID=1925020 RepID=A0A5M8RGP2_9BACI|nr:DUF6884 domain-containing protein [Bacillus swezeyi]KAA6447777.1 hypothetical protein DX927_21255 [Bacillus swezeyi]KAA6473855.1 hypothetical protein DX928_18475 [Bacillus swezeyi]TYS34362.1 hypothetical protein FZC77_18230 [Bacillus swezeyi]